MKNVLANAESVTWENGMTVFNADKWENHAPTGPTMEELYLENCKRRGTSATAQVTYVTLNKAIKMINVALERNTAKGESRAINAPELQEELRLAGFGKFCIECLDFAWGTHTLLCAPKGGESDYELIHARKDEEGRNTYRVQDLIKCFEAKYAYIFEASIAAKKAAKKADSDAKKAQRAADRAKKNADKAEALRLAKAQLEALLSTKTDKKKLSDEEISKMMEILKIA